MRVNIDTIGMPEVSFGEISFSYLGFPFGASKVNYNYLQDSDGYNLLDSDNYELIAR